MHSLPGGEGLWPLDLVDLPRLVRRSARGVVRVGSRIHFRVELHETPEAAAKARAQPEARTKRFLPGGGVKWPVITDHATLSAICLNEARAAQPGFHEICSAFQQHDSDQGVFASQPLRDGATGFVLEGPGNELRVVTNYHVVREGIERAGRTGGVYGSSPRLCPDTWVATSTGGLARLVRLEANASEQDWQAGRDWAVLRADITARPLELHPKLPSVGDRVWVLGFPVRTLRRPGGYPDANSSLRVASGQIRHAADDLLISDVDGVAGSSGSPVLDDLGRVVGVFRDHDHRDGEFDLRIGSYGGQSFITPAACLPTWLVEPGLQSSRSSPS